MPCIDPSVGRDEVIAEAVSNDSAECLQFLLKYPSFAEGIDENAIIISEAEKGSVNIIKILASRPNANPAAHYILAPIRAAQKGL